MHTAAGGRMDNARMLKAFDTADGVDRPNLAPDDRHRVGLCLRPTYFLVSTLAAVPGLCLLWWLRKDVQALEGPVAAKSEA